MVMSVYRCYNTVYFVNISFLKMTDATTLSLELAWQNLMLMHTHIYKSDTHQSQITLEYSAHTQTHTHNRRRATSKKVIGCVWSAPQAIFANDIHDPARQTEIL